MAASAAKTVVLVTGANSGIGFELAAQLMAKDAYHVLVGSRSSEKGTAALKDLQSRNLPGTAEFLPLDVTDDATIERAAASVRQTHGKIDHLVNNAGVGALSPDPTQLRRQMRDAFDANATGTAVVTQVFAPLLEKATAKTPRIVNVSSGMGSIGRRLATDSPSYKMREVQYRASKAAMNMITACQWVDYGEQGIKVFAYCPGFAASNFSPYNNAENGAKPTSEAVTPLVDILEGKRDDEAGKFLHNTGQYPW